MGEKSRIQVITGASIPFWRDERVIKAIFQIVSAVVVIGFLVFFFDNVLKAAKARGLGLGYDFLSQSAGIPLGESVIPYDPSDSYGRAFVVGILNTLKAALVGIVLATALGTVVAVARLSSNWLVSKIASVYIEIVRNIPLLVQLFVWYFAVYQRLPPVKEHIRLPGPLYLSQRGLYMPKPLLTSTSGAWAIVAGIAAVAAIILYNVLSRYQIKTGRTTRPALTAVVVLLGAPVLAWFLVGEAPLAWDMPVFGRFNFAGGLPLTTEYAAMVTGLIVYTGAFIAEVVRAGLLAVDRGQFEAARALGLKNMQVLHLVVFPQAMRVIVPPLISQYLNLTKNSSLAVGIGYIDLFYVGRTIINQAGRAVPVFVMMMVTYLAMSLITSAVLNVYNRRVQLVER
jgi:general L-amino acid transport system permease protein